MSGSASKRSVGKGRRTKRTTAAGAAAAQEGAKADDVRTRIMSTARQQFFRLGFARTTMDDLAASLGMSKKTLYLHFRRKEEIIDALITAKAGEIRAGFEEILAMPGLNFSERAARTLRHAVARVGEMSSSFLHDLQRYTPASYARLEEFRRRTVPGVWERLLKQGIAEGAVRSDIDPAATAQLILVVVQTLLLPENLERLHLEPHELVPRFVNLIFAGLLTPAGRAAYEKTPPLSGSITSAQ